LLNFTTIGNVSTAGELLVRRNINRSLTNTFALLLSPSAMVYFWGISEFVFFGENDYIRTHFPSTAAVCQPTVIFRMFLSETWNARSHGKCSSNTRKEGKGTK